METTALSPIQYTETRFVICSIGREVFAIPLSMVTEIQSPPPITLVPRAEGWLLGVINLRGEILSVIDIRDFLSCGPPPATSSPRLLIIASSLYRVAVWVDAVFDITEIDSEDIVPAESFTSDTNTYVRGVHSRAGALISLLDLETLLMGPRLQIYQ